MFSIFRHLTIIYPVAEMGFVTLINELCLITDGLHIYKGMPKECTGENVIFLLGGINCYATRI